MINSPLSRPTKSSPHRHYAQPSPRVSDLSRRPSKSKSKSQSPHPNVKKYVDVGTQWSPRTDTKPAKLEVATNAEKEGKAKEIGSAVMPGAKAANGDVPIPKSFLKIDTPSMKRRQSGEALGGNPPSGVAIPKDGSPKRAKSASQPVKILPLKYELCEVEDMVILIANMISELIETNDALPLRSGVLTRFHSRTPPGISVMDYLHRLAKHATLTPPLLLSMVYYIDRLCSLYPAFTISTLTVHRFLITAATVAAKGLSDSFWNNATYARVGGVKVAELGLLELDFLYRVDWKIVPNPEVLVDYYRGLVERSEGYELEDDSESGDEDDDGDLDGSSVGSPDDRVGKETDAQWRVWMDDVSTKKSDAS